MTSERRGRFNNGKTTVLRPKRLLHHDAKRIVLDQRLEATDVRLLLWMLDQPPDWRFVVANIAADKIFGARKKIHASLKRLRLAGYVTIELDGREGGGTEAGIYKVASEPDLEWAVLASGRPVDNLESENLPKAAQIAEGNTQTGAPSFGAARKDNSRVNPDTDTGLDDAERPVAPELKADGRSGGRKSHLTREEAERRAGGAKAHLPQKEPGSRPAKGSAMKGFASGDAEQTPKDRYTERLLDQMISVASMPGSRMPNPRKAARYMASLMQWRAEGFDFALDVLPTIAEVCSRVSDPDKPIVSWHYFTDAIREAHARRTKPASRSRPVQRQLEGWTPVGSAFVAGRRR